MSNLVNIRKQIKKRKPTYKRVQVNQFPKFKNDLKWRKPKGSGNKDRLNRKGHNGTLKVGYGSPKSLRFTNRDGFLEVLVHNKQDVKNIDSKTQIPVIGSSVGNRKRLEILEEAKNNKLTISNVKDIDKTIESLKKKKSDKKDSSNKVKKESESKESQDKESQESGDKKESESKEDKSSKETTESKETKEKASKSTKSETQSKKSQEGGEK